MVRKTPLILIALTVAQPAPARETMQDRLEALVRRPPADLIPLVRVTGDDLDAFYSVSTQGVTQIVSKGLLASQTYETSFLRAVVDKKTGEVKAQIYHIATYYGHGWKFFETANVALPDGLKVVDAQRIGSDVNCSTYGCTFEEDIGISVPFSSLEAAAELYKPEDPLKGVKYRLLAKSGDTLDEAVPLNEVVAFVEVVHHQQARIGVKPQN